MRITAGPLTDVEGILVRMKPNRELLVLSVDLLQRSVAVEVDSASVEPVASFTRPAGSPRGAAGTAFAVSLP